MYIYYAIDMDNSTESLESLARKRVNMRIGFLVHLVVYILVNLFLIILNLITSPSSLWFVWITLGWGIGLFFHGVSAFLSYGVISGYKDRMYASELENLKRKKGV